MQENLLALYANFLVRQGAAVKPGQNFIVIAPVEGAAFARLCADAAYNAGAKEVVVHYTDEHLSRLRMEKTATEVLEDVKPWLLQRYMDYTGGEAGLAMLRLAADDPELYKGLDTEKLNKASAAARKAMKPYNELTMSNKVQWCIAAIPGRAWAQKLFPNLPGDEAEEKLWETIMAVCRVSGGNPEAEWKLHTAALIRHLEWLNGLALQSIHLQSANGTNLTVGLADNHVWSGGGDTSDKGVYFLPNIPTEEVFTAPHRLKTNGVVKSSLPYVYNGNLIKSISVHFKDGVATQYSAEEGEDLLKQMLGCDEGALHLGEIALVPSSSPIRQSGLLFYSTLFDENAACHMAFGAGYPGTVKGGDNMSRDDLLALGVNDSLIHEDIMIGTPDMLITGLTATGESVEIFKNGEWVQ